MAEHNKQGKTAEQLVADYFSAKWYSILHRNYRHSHYEIDIVAAKDDVLHFIEVKTLSSSAQVYPKVPLTHKKV